MIFRPSLLHLLCSLLLVLGASSCNDYTQLMKSADSDYKYEAAKQFYAEGHYNRASQLLSELFTSFKGTDKGEESLYLLGMSSLNAGSYQAASEYLRKYYHSYPRGLYTEEARFHCAEALYRSTPEIKLDQTGTYEAVTEYQNFIETFPSSRLRPTAQDKIFELQDKLVEKEYLNAKLYYDLGTYFGNCSNGGSNYQACIITAENAIKDYPYTKRREAFAILILKAKFDLARQSIESRKEERYHAAIDEYYGFQNEFPESAFMPEATALYEKARQYDAKNDQDQ